uniref:Orc1-like AAA ATPase domain-containing protein n=1 Tax=Odontella aurita TaxID=265563 RepID=A0A7S4IC20_9STRA|mmetsp:Transcript_22906/g.67635  ORF Transcript_22906/g.67635 Transcript_22906/m.67635 type:complete len:893 (+) Transcript_22906:1919-4597(+)
MASRPKRFLFGLPPFDLRRGSGVDGVASSSSPGLPQLRVSKVELCGRNWEASTLWDTYLRVEAAVAATGGGGVEAGAREAVLLWGCFGSGKTAVVRKVRGDLAARGKDGGGDGGVGNALFVSGKFDAMGQRSRAPLSAVVSALDETFRGLSLSTGRGNERHVSDAVRSEIADSVGREGRKVLTEMIPHLGLFLMGNSADRPYSPSVRIDGRRAWHRLLFFFRVLFRALCAHVGPVVLFFDDLHWADESSLELLRVLVTDFQTNGLLFVGTYRDSEVGPDHPLTAYLRDIHSGGVAVTSLHIGNLTKRDVNTLLSETLHLLPRMTLGLSEMVLQKTGGNALFVVQFLQSLHLEGLLRFSLLGKRWEWDTRRIQRKDISDSVVALMTEKLVRLPLDVQDALMVSSAFGNMSQERIFGILERGDLLPASFGSFADKLDYATADGLMVKAGRAYQFHHDQIQLAAYELIPELDRTNFHLQIGRVLWKSSSAEEFEDFLFVIVDQLHRGISLVIDSDEKVKFAKLCLIAGKKACALSSFLPASAYLKAGIGLLEGTDWDCHRELCVDLYNSCSETEYILGEYDSMQQHLQQVLGKALVLGEKLRSYSTLVRSLGVRRNTSAALSTAIDVLGQLGEFFPSPATQELARKEVVRTRELLRGIETDSLEDMNTMQDPEKLEAMKFLAILAKFTYTDEQTFFALICCRMVQLSLSYGVCKESATGFANFAVVLCASKQVRDGYCLSKMSLATLSRFEAKDRLASVYSAAYGFINVWIEPMQSLLPCHQEAIEIGLSVGDTEDAMVNALLYLGTALQSGQVLGPLMDEMRIYSKQMLEYDPLMNTLTKPMRQATLNLLGRSANPVKLIGEEMKEETMLTSPEVGEAGCTTIYTFRLWLEYLF